jgi:glyoxylase-like metal-dependent hydrolase (beta-lactamase superfamily II)
MPKPFASSADTTSQAARIVELAPKAFGYISDYDPNTGFVVGERFTLVIDALATPKMARQFLAAIQSITDKPVTTLFLTHYHAVRVLGAGGFPDLHTIVATRPTRDLIFERGAQDHESEFRRMPRLFDGHDEIAGLTYPTLTFEHEASLHLGTTDARLLFRGSGHSRGDGVVWLPQERVLFAGDLVEATCALYCGDAYLRQWRDTLDRLAALQPRVIVPGRGAPAVGEAACQHAIRSTRGFVDDLLAGVQEAIEAGAADLKAVFDHTYARMTPRYHTWPIYEHCIPFNVARAYDELRGQADPAIWTAERDRELWAQLQG